MVCNVTTKSSKVAEQISVQRNWFSLMLREWNLVFFILSCRDSLHACIMRQGFATKQFLVGVRDEHHWEWIVLQGSTPLISYSSLYVSQHPACCLFREGQWPYHGNDLLREAAFSYLHALGVCAHWYATLTLSSCQDASNYASRWSEAERGFLCNENLSMGNVILLLPPSPQGWFLLMEGGGIKRIAISLLNTS